MKMQTRALVTALALCLAGAACADTPVAAADKDVLTQQLREAQRELAEAGKRVATLSAKLGGNEARVRMFRSASDPDRAVIGVILGDSGKDGVRIEGVTPGGPADKAGLRAGDTITAIRDQPVGGDTPVKSLRGALANLKVGDDVAVTYIRAGKALNGKIHAEAQGELEGFFGGGMNMFSFNSEDFDGIKQFGPEPGEIDEIIERAMGEAGHGYNMMALASVSGLRLTSMNPGLGRYFGVNTGALVLEVESDEYKGLQAGDVILEVDGQAVAGPRETLHALRKFDPQAQVELKLQRDRMPQLVKVSVPEKSRAFMLPPMPPAPPAPPSAPQPPRPPAPPPPPGEPMAFAAPEAPMAPTATSARVAPTSVAPPAPPAPPSAPAPPAPPAPPGMRILI